MPFEGGSTSGTPGSNGTTKDYSGFGNNGTVVNATWNSSGGYDGRGTYEFDSSTKTRVVIDYNETLDRRNQSQITITAWVKPTSLENFAAIVAKGRTTSATQANYAFRLGSGAGLEKRLKFYYRGEGDTEYHDYISEVNVSSLNSYTHLAVTYTFGNNNSIALYADGNIVPGNWTTGNGTEPAIVNTEPLWIGSINPTLGSAFNGSIDEVQIYNRSLSAEQIFALYQNRTDTIVANETADSDIWHACVTPNDGEQDGSEVCSNTVTIGTESPVILNISNFETVSIFEDTVRLLNFSVIVEDNDSVSNIASVNLTMEIADNTPVRTNQSCVFQEAISSTVANYTCGVQLWFFDIAGPWTAYATVTDAQGLVDNAQQAFIVAETISLEVGTDELTFPQMGPNSFNVTADSALTLNNTGNANISLGNIFVNASDLVGVTDPSVWLPAENFSIGTFSGGECRISGTANQTFNGTEVSLVGANLTRGNYTLADGTGQEELFFCIREIPATFGGSAFVSQAYFSNRTWDIRIE